MVQKNMYLVHNRPAFNTKQRNKAYKEVILMIKDFIDFIYSKFCKIHCKKMDLSIRKKIFYLFDVKNIILKKVTVTRNFPI